jgi:hypothetical protein
MTQRGPVRQVFSWLNQPLDPAASFGERVLRVAFMFGVGFGTFDVLIILSLLVGGRYQTYGRSARSGTCDFLFLSVAYPIGAFLSGAIIGATYSMRRRVWVVIPAMIASMVPWFTAIALPDVRARAHWAVADTDLVLVCSTLVGSVLGYGLWRRATGDSSRLGDFGQRR